MTLYDYLEPLLEKGTKEEIAQAKKAYWSRYKANWRRNRRQQQKEFTLSFTPGELQILRIAKVKHNRSYTRFIKESTLAYCKKQFLVPDTTAINRIRELLALNYNALQQITEEALSNSNTNDQLTKRMADLETKVLGILYNPGEVQNETDK